MSKISVKGLYKIFGADDHEEVIDLLEQGKSKKQIQEQTGAVVAVADASFEVMEHEIFVIMGLSGCGKSTLLRCINRLVDPTVGEVKVNEQVMGDLSDSDLRKFRQENMGMVFQHFGLLPHRTVLGNVEFAMELHGTPAKERRDKADQAIELVGLQGYEYSRVDQLSGGMQQRVGLARALAPDTPIVLMDEAFSALDPLIRAEMQEEFLKLQEKTPRTILFISHDLNESLYLGDRIAIMKEGRIVRLDEPEEILIDPRDQYVEAFVENVDRSKIISARTVMMSPAQVVRVDEDPEQAREILGEDLAMPVLEQDDNFLGIVTRDKLIDSGNKNLRDILREDFFQARPDQPLDELLIPSADSDLPIVVLDDKGQFMGWITRKMLLSGVQGNRMIS
jgi:glycine betaine/proline transport system ATP-binding protein